MAVNDSMLYAGQRPERPKHDRLWLSLNWFGRARPSRVRRRNGCY